MFSEGEELPSKKQKVERKLDFEKYRSAETDKKEKSAAKNEPIEALAGESEGKQAGAKKVPKEALRVGTEDKGAESAGTKKEISAAGQARAAENRDKAKIKRTKTLKLKQEKENEGVFNDGTSPHLNRQYNEGVLRRDGSPDISKGKSTPAAPKKMKEKMKQSKPRAVKKKLAKGYMEKEETVYISYAMEGITIKCEVGKECDLRDVMMKTTEQGGKILDKKSAGIATNYKCGFWPFCGGGVSIAQPIVKGGVLVEPKGHKKENHLVFICGRHDEQHIKPDNEDETDASSNSTSVDLKKSELCEDGSETEEACGDDTEDVIKGEGGSVKEMADLEVLVEDAEGEEVEEEEDNEEEEEEGNEEEEEEVEDEEEEMPLQSQSLLGRK